MAKRVCEVGRSPAFGANRTEATRRCLYLPASGFFRQHRRTAGERGGDELGNGDATLPMMAATSATFDSAAPLFDTEVSLPQSAIAEYRVTLSFTRMK